MISEEKTDYMDGFLAGQEAQKKKDAEAVRNIMLGSERWTIEGVRRLLNNIVKQIESGGE